MADGNKKEEKDKDNPFSFKNFVHSKKQDPNVPRSDKRKKDKTVKGEVPSSKLKSKDIFEDDVPFPDVTEESSDSRNTVKGTFTLNCDQSLLQQKRRG